MDCWRRLRRLFTRSVTTTVTLEDSPCGERLASSAACMPEASAPSSTSSDVTPGTVWLMVAMTDPLAGVDAGGGDAPVGGVEAEEGGRPPPLPPPLGVEPEPEPEPEPGRHCQYQSLM
jgi:hypothetical protein